MCPRTGVPWTCVSLVHDEISEDLLRSTSGVHARDQNNPSFGEARVASVSDLVTTACGRHGQGNTIGDNKFSQVDENFHPETPSTPMATRTT